MKLFGWLVPLWVQPAIMAGLLLALLQTRSTLHNARMDYALAAETVKATVAAQEAKWAVDGETAAENYATALATRQPLIVKSTDTVREYGQTPAGRALCASPERVQGIDALDASLFPAAPASGSSALPANPRP